jgi:hypothetical protein
MNFEGLGVFYLGKHYDLAGRRRLDHPLLYESRNLTTHAVCAGMTGSGKTGLCMALIEEAALDGIPALVIDPKGDLGNLMLTFPDLRPEDFAPWVNEEDARRKGLSVDLYAAQQAEAWKSGLTQWGQDGERIQRLRDAAEFAIYTPGSVSGRPLNVLRSFAAPPREVIEDREALRERVTGTAGALLSMAGIRDDPVQSREHILVSTLLDAAWRQERDLDLGTLIQQIQTPPVRKAGVLDIETFFPAKERLGLAMRINNLLASPGFEAWMEGEALEVGDLLYTPEGKPRIAILSIAHLSEQERMFFVSLLLNQVLSWMRHQPGTSSLRALLYMDEIFGYFPPVANPPSKPPLLTLLKQARAFGLGVVLATQNPADLDYKGLANCGTWFIGRLQTDRDKQRVLEGLEGASATTGAAFDKRTLEQTLAALGSRVFLLHSVQEIEPVIFETRWVLSYLRGPLTRAQIRQLGGGAPPKAEISLPPEHLAAPGRGAGPRPVLPPGIPEKFVPVRRVTGRTVYRPVLYGYAQVQFQDPRHKINEWRQAGFVTPITNSAIAVDWQCAAEAEFKADDLEAAPIDGAGFLPLPPEGWKAANYKKWERDFANWLSATQAIELYHSPAFKETSKPGQDERDFRLHLQQRLREERDRAVENLRRKYAPRRAALEDRIHRATQVLDRERAQASAAKVSAGVSFGTALLGTLLGRKTLSGTAIGRAGSGVRAMGRARKEAADVARAEEDVERLREQRAELERAFEEELDALHIRFDALHERLETIRIQPKKTGIHVRLLTLAWMPEG